MATIIILNGPPAAGKTTVAQQYIANQEPHEWAYLSHDTIRGLVKSGYRSADGLRSGWDKRTWSQWHVAAKNCVSLAKNFHESGISSLIDCYATKEEFAYWRDELQGTSYHHILLISDPKTERERNEDRDRPSKLTTAKMDESIEDFSDWTETENIPIINNDSLSIEKTVEKMASLITH